jgi:hypothetical protein
MLRTEHGVAVPDRLSMPGHANKARVVARVAVEEGLGDRVAWAALAGDGVLAAFAWRYGAKGQHRPRRPEASLFDPVG